MNRSLPLRILCRRPALLLLSTLAALFFLGCAILTLQVYFQLDELTAAQSDNMDYTIAQLEVDHVKLNSANRQLAQQDADSVARFRRRFDALYNRINTLLSSSLSAEALTA